MKNFYHVDATSLDQAVSLLDKYGTSAKVIGGGTEQLTTMKEYAFPSTALPQYIINLKTVTPALNTITTDSAGLHVGPLTTLATIASSSTVNQSWPALAQAAVAVATPNIRNIGTIAGNICQDVWCWYYRWEHVQFMCLRKGGSVCYAVAGNNVNHSIFGGPKGCYSVHPSDTGVALCALGASVVTTQRTIPMNQFFFPSAPGHVLNADEIIKDIVVPTPTSGSMQAFLKYRPRRGFDFAVASVGLLVAPASGTVNSASIWLGGVSPVPVEATAAETALKGQTISATTAATVAAAAVSNATPLTNNKYKVALTAGLVQKALLSQS
jgi:xanthine dehydrogenase YagS FAD-binding subunit